MKIYIYLILVLFTFSACNTKEVLPPEALLPIPTSRQIAWHEMEQYAFIHFTTNTFTGLEWGFGDESEDVFNPSEFNPDQWAKVLKDAGFKAIILTCKHHDGFCLWPSEFTEHSVKNSKWKDGKGDVVKGVRDACNKYGLKFGVYLSPWDRNRSDYGEPSYIEYYRNQLHELFTSYGPVFEMWLDGANGGDGYYGGANEKRKIDGSKYYDWPTTLKKVRDLENDIIFFSDAGPDIRWCGNERGYVNETNWNTIDSDTLYAGKSGISKLLNTGTEEGSKWIPAEVDVSIRHGWFYHEHEDDKVKTPQQLFDIYLSSVGRGSNLLLNIPPDRRGLLHENDIESLIQWKKLLDDAFKNKLAYEKSASASDVRGNSDRFTALNVTDGNSETYWATNDDVRSASIEIDLEKLQLIKYVLLQEYIKLGQRVKSFTIEAANGDNWIEIANSTTIGYKKIVKIDNVETSKIRINITSALACPTISNIEVY